MESTMSNASIQEKEIPGKGGESDLERILGVYDAPLFWPVLIAFISIIICALIFPDGTSKTLVTVRNFLIFNFSWALFALAAWAIAFPAYRLGKPLSGSVSGAGQPHTQNSTVLFHCGRVFRPIPRPGSTTCWAPCPGAGGSAWLPCLTSLYLQSQLPTQRLFLSPCGCSGV